MIFRYFRRTERKLGTTDTEWRKFFGICIQMGNLKYKRLRMYWEPSFRVTSIVDVIPRNRFLTLMTSLTATSEENPPANNTNKYWKVEPVVEYVRNACRSLSPEEFNSVDEQMIPFTGRIPANH